MIQLLFLCFVPFSDTSLLANFPLVWIKGNISIYIYIFSSFLFFKPGWDLFWEKYASPKYFAILYYGTQTWVKSKINGIRFVQPDNTCPFGLVVHVSLCSTCTTNGMGIVMLGWTDLVLAILDFTHVPVT